ncbi:hypothetical protein FisN_21Hu251 [Fistulifera solaris]|uniref:Uncharacterized protein n=1 Tax=Fistulifera solaris TaxID=1519565 RepID=A0A1Z5KPG7_FISSO|nr:hypothetical protein FisN_21Hu251 [Fistulifera solaris]|eukprot:GAX27901.1 hypothetical protein FisN_21Hu251 [Fistulifera solaris]
MAKIISPANPAIVEQDVTEPAMKKQRVGEQQSSAALTLLLLRDGPSKDPATNHLRTVKARPPVKVMEKEARAHVSITDDEDEAVFSAGIASKRVRPVRTVSSVKSVPTLPLQPLKRTPTLYRPPHFLPEGRPLAAPPSLRMPRGFVLRQPTRK